MCVCVCVCMGECMHARRSLWRKGDAGRGIWGGDCGKKDAGRGLWTKGCQGRDQGRGLRGGVEKGMTGWDEKRVL